MTGEMKLRPGGGASGTLLVAMQRIAFSLLDIEGAPMHAFATPDVEASGSRLGVFVRHRMRGGRWSRWITLDNAPPWSCMTTHATVALAYLAHCRELEFEASSAPTCACHARRARRAAA